VPSKKEPKSLADIAAASVGPQKRPDWTSVLPPKALDELLSARRKLLSGELVITKKLLARAIIKWSHEIGSPVTASEVTIAAWLRQND
jgi:hypothetical protein